LTELLRGLPPLIDARARVLILGSFPSAASLAAQQYYAYRQNQLWRILGAILEMPLAEMIYPVRAVAVKGAGIAIWDVYAECSREGSLDSAIRHAALNDFGALKELAPGLRRVCFNGKTAAKSAAALADMGYEVDVLPSTSPAFTLAFERKLALWRAVLAEH
jgi:hypoxanthine-DNA glycosylase